ncbi:MAG: hypothetical protein ABR588_03690 [Sphingomicrobium sp.]|nr:hypothetical protein [Sphingomonadales bacterium]
MIGPATDGVAGFAPSGPFETGPLRFLPQPIRETSSWWRSILFGWAAAFFPSLLLSALTAALLPNVARPSFNAGGPLLLFLLAVFSPLVETLIMAGILELLRRFLSPTAAVIVSAIGWAIAHSSAALAWGLVIWWPFLIFSTLYLAWRPCGKARAVGIVFATHACQNVPVALALLQQ